MSAVPRPTAVTLTLDCGNAERLASFWNTALGYVEEPPPAPFGSRAEWLASLGDHAAEHVGSVWLVDPAGVAPRLYLVNVPEPKTVKNRMHLDVYVSSASSAHERQQQRCVEAARLVAAGASVLADFGHHIVLADPEGNEFCLI